MKMSEEDDMKRNWRGKTQEEEKAFYDAKDSASPWGDRTTVSYESDVSEAILKRLGQLRNYSSLSSDSMSVYDLVDYTLLPLKVVKYHIVSLYNADQLARAMSAGAWRRIKEDGKDPRLVGAWWDDCTYFLSHEGKKELWKNHGIKFDESYRSDEEKDDDVKNEET